MYAKSVLMIAGTILVDQLVAKQMEIYKAKSAGNYITGHYRENTKKRRWNDEDRGRWTSPLITDIRQWIGRKFGEVNYYVTQMLLHHEYLLSFQGRGSN